MATCRDIIKSAYRRSGVKAASADISATQASVGLELLQDMYTGFVSGGMFGWLKDVYTDVASYEAAENQHVVLTTSGAVLVKPVQVRGCDGQYRAPLEASVIIESTTGSHKLYIYDAWSRSWLDTTALSLDDVAPLGEAFGESIKNLLAVKIADDVGVPLSPVLQRRAFTAKNSLASIRTRQMRAAEEV